MTSSFVMAQSNIVCDEGCAIHLLRSGQAEAILRCCQGNWFIPVDVQRAGLVNASKPLIAAEQLGLTDLASEEEYEWCVSLAYDGLHNGDAACIAIALNRRWAIATNEKTTHLILQRSQAGVQIITTPEIIKHWADVASPSAQEVKAVILAIQHDCAYKPPLSHPLHSWWKNCDSVHEQ